MQTVEHLRQLFTYNDWANRRILTALKENYVEKSHRILAHLLITEQEYFERLYGKDSKGFDFWPALSLEECGESQRMPSENFGSYFATAVLVLQNSDVRFWLAVTSWISFAYAAN